MRFSDFKCESCGIVFELMRNDFEDFPTNPNCPECRSGQTYRKFSLCATDVAEGLCGNEKNGYSKGISQHVSRFGRFKGNKK